MLGRVLILGVLWCACASDGAQDEAREEELVTLSARIRSWRAELPAKAREKSGCYIERAPGRSRHTFSKVFSYRDFFLI
jgi:hypothetical protein